MTTEFDSPIQKNDTYLSLHMKSNSKWIQALTLRPETTKLLGESIEKSTLRQWNGQGCSKGI